LSAADVSRRLNGTACLARRKLSTAGTQERDAPVPVAEHVVDVVADGGLDAARYSASAPPAGSA